jgi:hypothetical protein
VQLIIAAQDAAVQAHPIELLLLLLLLLLLRMLLLHRRPQQLLHLFLTSILTFTFQPLQA